MGVANASKPGVKLPPVPKNYRLFRLWVAAALRRIAAVAGVKLSIDGAESASVGADGSIHFKVAPGGVTPLPFTIGTDGKVYPGLVGGVMPTLAGGALDTTSNVIDLTANSGNFYVWFTLNFTTTYLGDFLSASTLTSVTVDTGTTIPADTDTSTTAVKHVQFNTITSGTPAASFFNTSLGIRLDDNGANATNLVYPTA